MHQAEKGEKTTRAPRLAFFLLRQITPIENRESITGDYEEIFDDLAGRKGSLAARAWYNAQVFKSLPRFAAGLISRRVFMFTTDFKLAIRNIRKSKGFSLLNVTGLALGMAVGFLMLLFVLQETTYDRFHEKSAHIFRISNTISAKDREMKLLGVPGPFGPLLKKTFPEVVNATRLSFRGRLPLTSAEKKMDLQQTLFADPDFFKIFTTHIILGDRDEMLAPPFSLVLTDESAKRLFGPENPVGKIVLVEQKERYTITGVIKKFPSNSHLQFDALISLSTRETTRDDVSDWMNFNRTTYVELRPDASAADLLPKFQKALDDHIPTQIAALNAKIGLGLQPLARIHLYSRTQQEFSPSGNPAYIRILALIAFFILLLAGINFVTLSTARSGRRAKEIGVRKVLGADRKRLVGQFLGESVVLSLISLTVAIGFIYLLLPVFNRLIAQNMNFQPFQSGIVFVGLVVMALVVGLLAGIYPALVLSGFRPQNTLKSQTSMGRNRGFLRGGLVTVQYVISIALISCTLIVSDQMRFLRNYDLGYDQEQMVEIPMNAGLNAVKPEIFKAEAGKIPGVESASLTDSAPWRVNSERSFRLEGAAVSDLTILPAVDTDGDYLSVLGLPLVAGRDFDKTRPADRTAVILNETVVRHLGLTDPIGKTVFMVELSPERKFVDVPLTVIGIVKDHHFESLHTPIRGQLILNRNRGLGTLLVKLRANAIPKTMDALAQAWKSLNPSRPFSYFFLSERFDSLYRTDRRLGQIFLLFALLALFVAGLGLFGLAAFTAERRTKEIGIRKVLGASFPDISGLLIREFAGWVLLANLIAWPIAYLSMKSWMQGFAYRAAFDPLLFAASGAAALLLAILTVGLRTFRISAANPVDSLRYE